MNRDEYLEYLLESLPRWPDDNHSAPHGWEFVDGQYVHTFHAPINIDEWNRAKIKPNTKIRILSEEHGEYAKRLFFKSDLYPNPAIPSSFKSEEESFMFFKGDGRITFAVTSSVFIKSECKEIFIEMPKAKEKSSANGSVGRMVTLNIPAEGSSNINAKVLAEKVGSKHDQGKPRYDLVPVHAEAEFVDVLTFGATKYAPNQWRNVPEAKDRYTAAALRHIAAYRMGETHDIESGKHHLAHAMCCLAFIIELDLEDNQ